MEVHATKTHSVKLSNYGLHSIGTRLFIAVMMAASVGLGGLGILFYQKLESVQLLQLKTETDIKVRKLDADLRSSESFLKSLVSATSFLHESGERSPEAYEKLILSFMSARPSLITGFGVMQKPQGLVDRQWFGPYIEESQPNRGKKVPGQELFSLVELWKTDQYPYLQYYRDVIKANRYFWSEPYLNEIYPIPLMTFAGPIYDRQGKLIAVMNGDINIKDLSQLQENVSSDHSIDYALVTKTGTLLSYSPDPRKAAKLESITSIPTLKLVWHEIQNELNQDKSQGFLKSDETKSYWVYQKVPSSQWIMLQAIPYEVVIKPAFLGALSATLVACIFLAVVVWLFTRSLKHRLQPILDICDVALIDKDYPIKPQDEISHLSNAFFSLMSQQNTLLNQLQLANQELTHSNHLKDRFLANMSHELRTPLNAILGIAEGLQDQTFGEVTTQQIHALKIIERSGSHLLELINDILDLAKIESGKFELDYSDISISHLCQESLSFIKQQAAKKNIQLELKIPPYLPKLKIDERRIRQVLINLLNNAVKFTPEGGCITLEVSRLMTQSLTQDDALQNCLRISVSDTGIGIAPENIDKLFQSFVQIDSALNRQYMGTGLGLALVKQIVELHGGKVGLSSKLGVGSCFTVDLPDRVLTAQFCEIGKSIGSQSKTSACEQTFPAVVLLLVTAANEPNMGTVYNYLTAKGYSVMVASNVQEAIALTKTQLPDLILVDIQIPGMKDMEMAQQVRLDPSLAKVPLVALTTLAVIEDPEKYLKAISASSYLTKPVKLNKLTALIEQFLATRSLML
jgi:signal transduction histidine kinase/CheY-like chemotaxis protein